MAYCAFAGTGAYETSVFIPRGAITENTVLVLGYVHQLTFISQNVEPQLELLLVVAEDAHSHGLAPGLVPLLELGLPLDEGQGLQELLPGSLWGGQGLLDLLLDLGDLALGLAGADGVCLWTV